MKKSLSFFLLTFILFLGFLNPVSALTSNNEAEITLMDVNIDVREDGTFKITETLNVNFNVASRGIFVYLPQINRMDFGNGVEEFIWPITDIEILVDEPVRITDEGNAILLRFGDERIFFTGQRTYQYSYIVHSSAWLEDDRNIFYYNIIGRYWDFPILRSTFTLNFHKDFDMKPIFYATSQNLPVNYTVSSRTISGSFDQELYREALTIELGLPDHFFQFPSHTGLYALMGLGLLGLVIVVFLFSKYGKDKPLVETVEFSPPDGLSSAEVAYIYKGMLESKDITSLIIYWASESYLEIEELDKDNILLRRLKDYEGENLGQNVLFEQLFNNRDEVTTHELKDHFAASIATATSNIPYRFTKNKDQRVFNRKATAIKVLTAIFMPFIPILVMGIVMHTALINSSLYFGYLIAPLILTVVLMLVSLLVGSASRRQGKFRIAFYVLLLVLGAVYIFVNLAMTYLATQHRLGLQDVALAVVFITSLFYVIAIPFIDNMMQRTDKGQRWYGQILGLRRFIQEAEKERLELFVEETPYIFYDILPFAYVLGVSDLWSKKFEGIAIPPATWYHSSNPNNMLSSYLIWSSLNRNLNTVNRAMISSPASKGNYGGGRFGGGSGGGGFSGGGFGGSGGGRW